MLAEWILRRPIPIIFMIAILTYVIMMGAFFVYTWRDDQNILRQERAITECLSSGGHIGPETSCRHENPTDDALRELLPP
jgi:hypothetical protein